MQKEHGYSGIKRDFFEILLMSHAKTIFRSDDSTFSLVAAVISGKDKAISYSKIFSEEVTYDAILANHHRLEVSPSQKAISHFQLYRLGCKINKDLQIVFDHAIKAYNYDSSNLGYMLTLFILMLYSGKAQRAEEMDGQHL